MSTGSSLPLTEAWPDALYPAAPYPGTRPPASFVHLDGRSHPLSPDPTAPSGWRAGATDLDEWLAARGAVPLSGRVPVLAYGSNANPSKITWMREERGLTGPVVVFRATTTGVAAAWAAGLRVVDDQRPAVLVAADRTEQHAVWMAAPEQFASLDRVEGRVGFGAGGETTQRYRLARLRTGTVRTEDGGVVDGVYAYLGLDRIRHQLLVDGAPVYCKDVDQAGAKELTGEPAPDDGLDAETVDGVPRPEAWPPRVFVYGLLMPGQPSWSLMAPHAVGEPRAAVLPGTVSDTGLGFPALTRDGVHGEVPGYVVELADPVAALPGLDEYEGPEYRRVRVVLGDGTVCWTYLWIETSVPLTPLPRGWR